MKDADGNVVTKVEIEAIAYYGGLALILGGMAGLYIPYVMKKEVGVEAFSTYVFAVLAPIAADFLLGESYWQKLSKVIKLRMGFAGGAVGIAAIIALLGDHDGWGIPLGAFAMFSVVPIWFAQALYSGRFRPEPPSAPPPKGSLGGEVVNTTNLGGDGLPS